MTLLGHSALVVALIAIAACTTPPKPDPKTAGDAGTVSGWVTTGTFQ